MSLTLPKNSVAPKGTPLTKVTITAKGKKAVSFTFNTEDVSGIRCKNKSLKMGADNGTIDVGNLYARIVNFLVKLRDANLLSKENKKANEHDTIIDYKDWQNIAKTGLENEDMVTFTQGFEVEF